MAEEPIPALAMPTPLGPGMPLLSPAAQPCFDVDAFLCSRTVGQDVHIIVKELRAYKHTIQENLVQVINEKYRDFVALLSMLQREAGDIHSMRDKDGLQDVQASLGSLRDTLGRVEADMVALVQEEERIMREKQYLHTLLDMDRMVQKLSSLLGLGSEAESVEPPTYQRVLSQVAQCDFDDPDADECIPEELHELTHAQRMANAKQFYAALQHLLASIDKDQAGAYLVQLEPVLKDIYHRLLHDTMRLYDQSLHEPVDESCHTLSLALDLSLELGERAVDAILDRISAQHIEPHVKMGFDTPGPPHLPLPWDPAEAERVEALTHLAWDKPVVPPATLQLRATYDALLHQTRSLSHLFQVTEKVGGDMLDVFNDLWWQRVATSLEKVCGSQLFFVGKVDEFCSNYYLTQAFLRELKALAPTPRAAAAFQRHAKTMALQRRWAFSAFFQLRARDIITSLEQGLETSGQDERFYHAAFSHFLYAFTAPWYMTRHFAALSAREWRLSLHVLSRYRTWLDAHTWPESHAETTARSAAPADESVLSDDELQELHGAMGLLVDLRVFEDRVRCVQREYILPKLLGDTARAQALCDSLNEAMEVSLHAYDAMQPRITQFVLNKLSKKCAAPLRHVRASHAQYRTRLPTDAPSAFVEQMLRPLHQVWGSDAAPIRQLPTELVTSWMNHILDGTFARYTSAVDTITRNLESLRRLKRGTLGLAADDAATADQAVYQQLATDIEALAAHIEAWAQKTGLPLTLSSPAWKALWDAARRT